MMNGNNLMITVVNPYKAVCPNNFLYKTQKFSCKCRYLDFEILFSQLKFVHKDVNL